MATIEIPRDTIHKAATDTVNDTSIGPDLRPKISLYSQYPIHLQENHVLVKVLLDEINNVNEAAWMTEDEAWTYLGLWHDIVEDPDDARLDDIHNRLDELERNQGKIVSGWEPLPDDVCGIFEEDNVLPVSHAVNSEKFGCYTVSGFIAFIRDRLETIPLDGYMLEADYVIGDINNVNQVDNTKALDGLEKNDYLIKSLYGVAPNSNYKVGWAQRADNATHADNADYAEDSDKVDNRHWDQFLQGSNSSAIGYNGSTIPKHRVFFGAEFATIAGTVLTDIQAGGGGDNDEQIRPKENRTSQVGRSNRLFLNGYFDSTPIIINDDNILNQINTETYTESNILDNLELISYDYRLNDVGYPLLRMKTKQALYDNNTLNIPYDRTRDTYEPTRYYGDTGEQIALLALALKQERVKFDNLVLRVQALETIDEN